MCHLGLRTSLIYGAQDEAGELGEPEGSGNRIPFRLTPAMLGRKCSQRR